MRGSASKVRMKPCKSTPPQQESAKLAFVLITSQAFFFLFSLQFIFLHNVISKQACYIQSGRSEGVNGMGGTSCCIHVILEVFVLVYDTFLIFCVKIRTMKPALNKILYLTNVVTLSTNVHLILKRPPLQ